MSFEWKEMREWGKAVGREGMSVAVLEAVEDFDGSYIGAMILAGKLKAISQAAGCDEYWSEKVGKGYHQALSMARYGMEVKRGARV